MIASDVCVVGAGPAGLVLAIELGRAGKSVVVVESTMEFERHFRGESIVPDAVWMLRQMGILQKIEAQGAKRSRRFEMFENGKRLVNVDFAEFDKIEKYPMEIPQVMLLGALLEECAQEPSVTVLRGHELDELVRRDGRVRGVTTTSAAGGQHIDAALVVGSDGRYSTVRAQAGIPFHKEPLARDVIWFRVPCPAAWDLDVYRVMMERDRHVVVLPTHPDMLRVGLNVPKGGAARMRADGIEVLHDRVDAIDRDLGAVVRSHVRDWSDTVVLDIFTTRVPQWHRDGVVLIGDAAHTLSPVLGHGVNHAMQDGRLLGQMLGRLDLAGAADRAQDGAVDAVLREFQAAREPGVAQSRGLQLRQERLFTLRSRAQTRLRRALYRTIGALRPLREAVFGRAYFTLLQR